jgi:putative salt-induced outer membrane protein
MAITPAPAVKFHGVRCITNLRAGSRNALCFEGSCHPIPLEGHPVHRFCFAGICLTAVLLLDALPLTAQSAPTPTDSFRLAFDLGYVNTAGNTDVTTLNFGEHLTYGSGGWLLAHRFVAVEGRSGGDETAAQYKTDGRLDRAFSSRFGAYALAGYERNVFAGIGRRLEEGAGLTAKAVAQAHDLLAAEGGVSFIQQRSTARVDDTFAAGRAALSYQHSFTETATFVQTIEVLANLENSQDRRINSETSLTAPISQRIALKSAYLIRYDHQPEPGFKTTDRVFTTGIQIVF